MLGLPDMAVRSDLLELMDEPGCSEAALLRTVDQFDGLNRLVSRYRTLLKRHVLRDMEQDPDCEYRLADLGAGGCDIAAWLLAQARRRALRLAVEAWEGDARIVAHARRRRGATEGLNIRQADALSAPILEPVDYLFGNHFLHHLADDQIVGLLSRWAPFVRRRMVFSDLLRRRTSYAGYALLTLFFRRDTFSRVDGLLSIRRGFHARELLDLARRAGLEGRSRVETWCPGRVALMVDFTS